MSIFAGKTNSSAWLRERLKIDAWRARMETVDLGVQGEKLVSLEEYDPVLRSHYRFDRE
jgi:hypothetical protein